jgi:Tol biopolymer transport system component
MDPRLNAVDPWIIDARTGFATPLRATVEGALASNPTWSHDGKTVFHSSGHGTMRASPVAGGKDEAWTVGAHWPSSSAPDGSVILVNQQGTTTGGDIMIVSLTGDHTPKRYLQTPFNESSGRFSPDGKFVAYVSNETGRNEVYVQSFPSLGTKVPVSARGGDYAEWSEDGSELYFAHEEPDGTRSLMVARRAGAGFTSPQRLFGGITGFWDSNRSGFAVFDKGQRFLVSILVPVTTPQVITVGQNWMATLPGRR